MRWRSPLRGPGLTSLLGVLLLVAVAVVAATGFASHAAYAPDLGRNAIVDPARDLQPLVFAWPTRPTWLYALNQGLHVTVGIAAVPLLLAKLWSVIPRLFELPPVRSPAHALERLTLIGLVGGGVFEFATGILNVQLYYPWGFDFVEAHYYGAWVFLSALVVHVAVKLPTMRRAYRERRRWPEPWEPGGLAPRDPAAPTISRRGFLAVVAGASGALVAVLAGQSAGGPLRRLALLAPRREGFPVNKTARAAGVTPAMTGRRWRLDVEGAERVSLRREELAALPQHVYDLPIACVEGWSTRQRWSGVRLRDLAALAGAEEDFVVHVESLQPRGRFRQTTLSHAQASDERALLALRVNDADLSLDHGYPARIVVPALPGVHCTKWVSGLTFARA
jgi:DMSO/TMAO reductase YedYZ molybdopterin-dependent catalytic subunit